MRTSYSNLSLLSSSSFCWSLLCVRAGEET